MKTKLTFSILTALLVSVIVGAAIAFAIEVPELSLLISAGLFALSFVRLPQMSGVAMATVYQEVWTKQVKEELTTAEKQTFLEGIEDFSRYVANVGDEMQVIHLVYMGVMPDVLINNTTYPIDIQALDQEDIPISLDKYQTKVTPVTDDELYALSYDKIQTVKNKHSKAIVIAKNKKAIHAIAPAGNTARMPVLVTTGADDGTGRKRLVWEDIVRLKAAFDELEYPDYRRLVLSTDHQNDLLLLDQKFKDQFFNPISGKPYSQLGFEFFSYVANPFYNPATLAKLSFGAVPAGTDRRASVAFCMERVAKAAGWTKMYWQEAKNDPQYQRNLVNFRHNAIVMPTREEARGAIVSANV